MSDYLPKDEQSVHYIYDPHQSQTAKNVHRNWSITYADGSAAKGEVWRDVVEVAGIRSDGQEVEVAISINDRLLGEEFDGILGLGFPNINRCQGGRCTPFFHRIMDQLPLQTFAVNMKEEGEKEGSMDFGWIDSTKFKGELQYTVSGWFSIDDYSLIDAASVHRWQQWFLDHQHQRGYHWQRNSADGKDGH